MPHERLLLPISAVTNVWGGVTGENAKKMAKSAWTTTHRDTWGKLGANDDGDGYIDISQSVAMDRTRSAEPRFALNPLRIPR